MRRNYTALRGIVSGYRKSRGTLALSLVPNKIAVISKNVDAPTIQVFLEICGAAFE
jgi:hypothetical protein